MSSITIHKCDRCHRLGFKQGYQDSVLLKLEFSELKQYKMYMDMCVECGYTVEKAIRELLHSPTVYTSEAVIEVTTEDCKPGYGPLVRVSKPVVGGGK